MKRIITLGAATVLALPLIATATVFAENTASSTTTNTTTSTPAASPTTKTTTSAADLKALADRLAKRKADLKLKLTSAETLRLQTKCVAAQTTLGTLKERINTIDTNRTAAYKSITDNLTSLSEKLKNKSVDTTAFDADLATLQTKFNTFATDLATYKQAVADLVIVDCKADPDGFKASLETARTSVAQVNKDAVAVRSYLNDTLKPLLQTIRTQLQSTKTGGTN